MSAIPALQLAVSVLQYIWLDRNPHRAKSRPSGSRIRMLHDPMVGCGSAIAYPNLTSSQAEVGAG
jgi:hypothetical protein